MPLSKYSRWLAVLLVGLAAGCGDGRVGVSGSVSFDAQPLESGTINFYAEGSEAPAGGAPIENGEFKVPAIPGLLPGSYRVSISATAEAKAAPPAGGVAAPDGRKPATKLLTPPHREKLPARYNTSTELRADVVSSTSKNVFKFDLESKKR